MEEVFKQQSSIEATSSSSKQIATTTRVETTIHVSESTRREVVYYSTGKCLHDREVQPQHYTLALSAPHPSASSSFIAADNNSGGTTLHHPQASSTPINPNLRSQEYYTANNSGMAVPVKGDAIAAGGDAGGGCSSSNNTSHTVILSRATSQHAAAMMNGATSSISSVGNLTLNVNDITSIQQFEKKGAEFMTSQYARIATNYFSSVCHAWSKLGSDIPSVTAEGRQFFDYMNRQAETTWKDFEQAQWEKVRKTENELQQCMADYDAISRELKLTNIPPLFTDATKLSLIQQCQHARRESDRLRKKKQALMQKLHELAHREMALSKKLGDFDCSQNQSPPIDVVPTDDELREYEHNVNSMEAELAKRRRDVEELHAVFLNFYRQLEHTPTTAPPEVQKFYDINSFPFSIANISELRHMCEEMKEQRRHLGEDCDRLQLEIDSLYKRLQLNEQREATDFGKKYFGKYLPSSKAALEVELHRLNQLKRQNMRRFIDKTRDEIREEHVKCRLIKIGDNVADLDDDVDSGEDEETALERLEEQLKELHTFHLENSEVFEMLTKFDQCFEELLEAQRQLKLPETLKNRGGIMERLIKKKQLSETRMKNISGQLRSALSNHNHNCLLIHGMTFDEYHHYKEVCNKHLLAGTAVPPPSPYSKRARVPTTSDETSSDGSVRVKRSRPMPAAAARNAAGPHGNNHHHASPSKHHHAHAPPSQAAAGNHHNKPTASSSLTQHAPGSHIAQPVLKLPTLNALRQPGFGGAARH